MKYLITIVSLAAFAAACTYELEGEFVKDIDSSRAPTVSVSLNKLQPGSTIIITQDTKFTFNYNIDPGILKGLTAYIDETTLLSSLGDHSDSGTTLNFTVGSESTSPGIHTLKIVVTSTSGTGSLADAEGDEMRQVEISWKVNFITNIPDTPVLSLSNANGYLKVSWKPYTRLNFARYVLLIERDFNQVEYRTYTDSLTSSFVDSTYVGGYGKKYTLSINTVSYRSVTGAVSVNDNVSLKQEVRMLDTTYLFTWDKADYLAPFNGYTLVVNQNELHTFSNVNDTSFRYDPTELIFGQPIYASVTVQCKDRPSPSYSPIAYAQTDAYLPGTNKFNATAIAYNNTVDRVYGVPYNASGYFLRAYSSDLQDLNDEIDYRASIPFTGPNGYTPVDGFGINAFDLQTKAVVDQLDLTAMTNDGHVYGINAITGSSTGVVLVYFLAKDDFNQIIEFSLIYDMVNNKVLSAMYPNYNYSHDQRLSGNGKYLISAGRLYINNGSYFDTGWTLPSSSCYFRQDNPEEVIRPGSSSYEIRKSSDGTLLRSIPVPPGSFNSTYDPVRHIIMFFTDNEPATYHCVDIESLEQFTIRGVKGSALMNGYFINTDFYFFKAIN